MRTHTQDKFGLVWVGRGVGETQIQRLASLAILSVRSLASHLSSPVFLCSPAIHYHYSARTTALTTTTTHDSASLRHTIDQPASPVIMSVASAPLYASRVSSPAFVQHLLPDLLAVVCSFLPLLERVASLTHVSHELNLHLSPRASVAICTSTTD